MESRRIIKVGERSYGVTLPKRWVELHGLRVGSPVKIIVDRDKLMILPGAEASGPRKARISEDDVEKLVRDVIAYYIEGVDELEIETKSTSALVTKIEGKLPGVVLMEMGGMLKLRIVTKEDIDINEAVRSMYTTVDAMFNLFIQMVAEGRRDLAEEILRLDDQIDRLYFFSLRTVKRNIGQKPEHYVDYVITIKNLEHVGDAIDRATNYYLQKEVECVDKVLDIFKRVYEYLKDAFDAFYSNDVDKALRVLVKRAELANATLQVGCAGATAMMHEAASIVGFAADIAEAAYSKAKRQ
ncbi:MAG: phosphate uptake regulator PhoU [Pyrobaculum sp.]